jgi:nitric oxide dioxygenase
VPVEADAYVLGPKPFMGFVDRTLSAMGLPDERRHHEFFGPAEALA